MIVNTYKKSLCCCCVVEDCIVAVASPNSMILWDLFAGKELFALALSQKLSPIGLTAFNRQNVANLILQTKEGKILLFIVHQEKIIKMKEYELLSLGFTRLPFQSLFIDENGKMHKQVGNQLFTVRYENTIEKRDICTGALQKEYSVAANFQQVNFLLLIEDLAMFSYLVAEEGGRIKKYSIEKVGQIKAECVLQLSSEEQLKIILWIEAISSELAFVCLRNSNPIQINFEKMEILSKIDLFGARIIKMVPVEPNIPVGSEFAFCTKSEMGFFGNGKTKGRERIDKNFILDLDVIGLGSVGITEEGRILFLPRSA